MGRRYVSEFKPDLKMAF